MTNDYLVRLALVVNTSHSKFMNNLISLVVYTLYISEKSGKYVKKSDVKELIEKTVQIEFSEKEIFQALEYGKEYFCVGHDGNVFLTEAGHKKIHPEKQEKFDSVLSLFVSSFEFDYASDEVSEILYRFLYGCIGSNIETLLNVLHKKEADTILLQMEEFNVDEKKLINTFLDWDNSDKNEIVFELVSFAVDYCRLTVKKDAANFNTILQGKKFYLDANVIFRLMGLNNSARKETIMRFVEKCKSAKIKLLITSETRKEILDSIHYHVGRISKSLNGYHGSGASLRKFYSAVEEDDGFLNEYYKWASDNKMFGKFDEFEQHLKRLFYSSVSDISLEEVKDIQVSDELIEDYMTYKKLLISRENAIYDLKNIKYIEKLRSKSGNESGWNTSLYLISADHKLISWSTEKFSYTTPIVVLPSAWYAILLKVHGRATDDMLAFTEFIKLRYFQDNTTDNINSITYAVCQKTSDGVIQDLLLDQICDSNIQFNNLCFSKEKVEQIVNQSYDRILEQAKKEEFDAGHTTGKKDGIRDGRRIGEKAGRIKARIEQIDIDIPRNTIRERNRNIFICVISTIVCLLVIYFALKYIPDILPDNLEKQNYIISAGAYIVPTGIVDKIIVSIFPLDIEKIRENESLKVEEERKKLEQELKEIEDDDK